VGSKGLLLSGVVQSWFAGILRSSDSHPTFTTHKRFLAGRPGSG